jgi:hypothetical protein
MRSIPWAQRMGFLMSHPSQEGQAGSLPVVALRVFRQAVGSTHYVRLVSREYGGCFTHWMKQNSQYCDGPRCIWNCAKQRKQWKGYGAADVYDPVAKLYVPFALEITESMELDLRGRWTRGSIWRIHWPFAKKGHNEPKRAEFVRQLDEREVPPVWDVVPCLLNMFHIFSIDLTVKNPMPPRVLVQSNAGPDPLMSAPIPPVASSDEMRAGINRLKGMIGGMPDSPGTNGKAKDRV